MNAMILIWAALGLLSAALLAYLIGSLIKADGAGSSGSASSTNATSSTGKE